MLEQLSKTGYVELVVFEEHSDPDDFSRQMKVAHELICSLCASNINFKVGMEPERDSEGFNTGGIIVYAVLV